MYFSHSFHLQLDFAILPYDSTCLKQVVCKKRSGFWSILYISTCNNVKIGKSRGYGFITVQNVMCLANIMNKKNHKIHEKRTEIKLANTGDTSF